MKSLESAAFIGGFISAHYVKLYIKRSWKPSGSPTVKRRFQIRKTRASNISSFFIFTTSSLFRLVFLSVSPRGSVFFLRLGHSVLFLAETDLQQSSCIYENDSSLTAVIVHETLFPHHKISVGEKYWKSGCEIIQLLRWCHLILSLFNISAFLTFHKCL